MAQTERFDIPAIVLEIDGRLRALPSPNTEAQRSVRREFSKRLRGASASAVIGIARELLDSSRFVAYELINCHAAALGSLNQTELERLGQGIDSWGAVDCFACYLSGPAWREEQVPDNLIHKWARSRDRWWRRAALVSTVPLNNKARGGSGDPERTLTVCQLLAPDHDDMVAKALSWALRELSKRDPVAVSAFLAQHEDVLAARVVREARNKLTTGLKNPTKTR